MKDAEVKQSESDQMCHSRGGTSLITLTFIPKYENSAAGIQPQISLIKGN